MMQTCSGLGMCFGMLGMATRLIALGAIIYMIVAKRYNCDLDVAH